MVAKNSAAGPLAVRAAAISGLHLASRMLIEAKNRLAGVNIGQVRIYADRTRFGRVCHAKPRKTQTSMTTSLNGTSSQSLVS